MKQAKAVWKNVTVAESLECIVVEGNYYFPRASIKKEYFEKSELSTHCPWKGDAVYYSLVVDDEKNQDCAWTYEEPSREALRIKDYIAFWKGVEVITETPEEKEAKIAESIQGFLDSNPDKKNSKLVSAFQSMLSELDHDLLTYSLPPEFINHLSFFNFSNSNDACFHCDSKKVIREVNPTFEFVFTEMGELRQTSLFDLLDKMTIVKGDEKEAFFKKLDSHGWAKLPIVSLESAKGTQYYSLDIAITKHGDLESLSGLQGQFTNITREVELSKSLEASRGDMRRLLDGLSEGLFYFDPDGQISDEKSKALNEILPGSQECKTIEEFARKFGKIDQETVDECLRLLWPPPEDENFFSDFLSTISMLPSKTKIENFGMQRDIKIEYRPLYCSKGIDILRVLVVVIDETEALQNEKEAKRQAERVRKVTNAAVNTEGFQNFVNECTDIFIRADKNFDTGCKDLVQLKRDLHTLKGSVGTYEFMTIASEIHLLEEWILEGMLNEKAEKCHGFWKEIRASWEQEVSDIYNVLGLSENQEKVSVSRKKIADLRAFVAKKAPEQGLNLVDNLYRHPLSEVLFKYEAYIEKLAAKNGEKQVHFEFDKSSEDVLLSDLQAIDGALIHIFRNCFDHGIEETHKRIEAGKSESGKIIVSYYREKNGSQVLILKDDGGGIDGDKLAEKALEAGIWNQEKFDQASYEEKIELIFAPSLSSKDSADDVSGRGVGMDAVRSILIELGGNISVQSELKVGTTFTLTFPQQQILKKAS